MGKKMEALVLALLACLLIACGTGNADTPAARDAGDAREAPRRAATGPYADQNRDGRVTRDEARASPALAASFERYDRNRDGALDRAEFAQLEAASSTRREAQSERTADADSNERHQLRPRREFPRPLD